MKVATGVTALIFSALTFSTNATVVVIEGDGANGALTYSEDGFTMEGLGGNAIDGLGRGDTAPAMRIGLTRPALPLGFLLTQDNGNPFELISFQAEGINLPTDAVTVTGVFANGSPDIVQTFLIPQVPSPGFSPFGLVTLSGYTGLESATFEAASGGVRVYDNITLDGELLAAVPEPTTISLLALGLAGVGFARRRLH